MASFAREVDRLRLWRFIGRFVSPVDEAAILADEYLLTFGTIDLHLGLVNTEVALPLAGLEGPMAGFANQGLFTEAAFDHEGSRPPYGKSSPGQYSRVSLTRRMGVDKLEKGAPTLRKEFRFKRPDGIDTQSR